MVKKFKLNKSELTRLKREERMYFQFLPVLKLKQEQLQIERIKIKNKIRSIKIKFDKTKIRYKGLISLIPDPVSIDIKSIITIKALLIREKSIAGVKVPVLKEVIFNKNNIPYFNIPSWIVRGVDKLRDIVRLYIEQKIVAKQFHFINKELKKATQKVNLFEKVLLPETKEAIKKIKIVLNDEQVASVGRGKIAKNKSVIYNTLNL